MGIYDFTIYDLINRNALLFKDKTAWWEAADRSATTFSEIKKEADRLAAALQRAGLHKGDRIGIVGKNCLEYFLLLGAAAALGAIVVPINWRLSADEAAFNLNDTQPRLVFMESDTRQWLDAVGNQLPKDTARYNLRAGQGPLPDFATDVSGRPTFTAEEVCTDDGIIIIHTAAVGGRPRGALLSHGNLWHANIHLLYGFGLTENDVHLSMLPLFHVAGICMALLSFHAGAPNINMRKFDAHAAVRLIAEHKVTLMFEFAPILTSILDAQAEAKADITSLRTIMGLDAPETIERFEQLTGGSFYSLYGQTETSMLASMGRYKDCPGGAGRPLPLVNLALLNEADEPVPQGQEGEIALKGPMVFKGYWGLETETAATFAKGWHHTGDLGRLDENGFLWYAGRKPEKELIKPGGENVYPAEVEKVILEHPAVDQVVVFGVPDPKWKEGIKAVCTLKKGHVLTDKELIDFVGKRIARYKKPQYVEIAAEFPLTAAGAIDRQKVKVLYG
jgi:long-chain acyl-CoA synthetase